MASVNDEEDDSEDMCPFRPFTRSSLFNIEKRIATEKANNAAKKAGEEIDEEEKPGQFEVSIKPNPKLQAGSKLPPSIEDFFQPNHVGIPLEDIDEFYKNEKTFNVIGKDKTIFRFSATNGCFALSPFNCVRRAALYILVHPFFSALVIITIIANCVLMTINLPKQTSDVAEYVFTVIYTLEACVKMTARGFVLAPFTYMRDPWNWLDFGVITIAYVTIVVPELENLSALRTFRVLRALKTVAVVPGLKTIVGALLGAVIRLRDVAILTSFVLSIFALVGMQLYKGRLRNKCVAVIPENFTDAERVAWQSNQSNWIKLGTDEFLICSNQTFGGQCPLGFQCLEGIGDNPNSGYTSFDNFGWALLSAYRLMTQDYWENLYVLILRAEGIPHAIFFILVILLGSFYLINLILAIVAMAYDEQQKADQADADELAAEKDIKMDNIAAELKDIMDELRKSPSLLVENNDALLKLDNTAEVVDNNKLLKADNLEEVVDEVSVQSEKYSGESIVKIMKNKASSSLPGSPFLKRQRSKYRRRYSEKQAKQKHSQDERKVLTSLEYLNIPYVDDSNAESPCTEEVKLRNLPTKFSIRQRPSLRRTKEESARRSSFASQISRTSFGQRLSPHSPDKDKFSMLMEAFERTSRGQHEDLHSGSECGSEKSKLSSRTPRASNVDPQDVHVLRELIMHMETVSGKKSLLSGSIFSAKKEPIKDIVYRLCCSWDTPPWFKNIQKWVGFFILDAFIDLFITLCIIANTVVMAMDHHGMSKSTQRELEWGNSVFSYIFAVEACLKIIALGLIQYLKDGWNCFDFLIVALSFLEMMLEGVKGLTVLRTFRLLRVFKLAKSWPTLNMLIRIVARTLGALGNLTFVLGIVVFIFAVMGQQLFSEKYNAFFIPQKQPRWNFTDFLHSFMVVFRVLCGEWIESMWDCMKVTGNACIPFFMLTFIIGNLVCLNLFLALLLSSFHTEGLASDTGEIEDTTPNKLAEAFNRISRFGKRTKVFLIMLVKRFNECERQKPLSLELNGKNGTTMLDVNVIGKENAYVSTPENGHCTKSSEHNEDVFDAMLSGLSTRTPSTSRAFEKGSKCEFSETDVSSSFEDAETQSLKKVDANGEPEINEVDVAFVDIPDDCLCKICKRKVGCCFTCEKTRVGKFWWKWRCSAYKLVHHKYFETFIIIMIIVSSLALALEDIYLEQRPILKEMLDYMDKMFTAVFLAEMFLKWFAFGLKHYFTDAWCWLDFVIVGISIILLLSKAFEVEDAEALKAMRTLRALRPLRAVSRWEGMRVVVNALIKAIPSIFNVLLVCLVFWLIFGIMGVQFFAGKFYRCLDANGERVDASIVANRNACDSRRADNFTWENMPVNFDNVLNAYLALFQIATYKGWVDIITAATDSQVEVGMQPVREVNKLMYLYFVLFIIFGSFFTLNLFIGVIIDNFNKQKKKAGGGSLEMFMTKDQKKYYKAMKRMQSKSPIKATPRPNAGSLELFMTEDQKKYYHAMKRMQSKSPQKSIPRPRWFPADFLFDLTTSQVFDIVIMIFIMLNMLTMTLEHYGQSKTFEKTLSAINICFIAIFTAECVMKITGLRLFYFKFPWNIFDFIVVVLSILDLSIGDFLEYYIISPTLLRVVRVFRVGRALRLVKSAKGIRTLLFALAVSLPALFNIGLLLFLVLFIYAAFGMSFFKDVKTQCGGEYMCGGLDDVINFTTFFKSIVTLFQMCTASGWDGVLIGLSNTEDCDKRKHACVSYPLAVFYLVSFLVITFLVIVNMYIAVIIENFSQATEDVQQGVTPEDFDMFYEKWEKYDPDATQYIPLDKLSDFVAFIEEPLQLSKPNHFLLVKLDIPIYENDLCYCRDILEALTKHFLKTTDTGNIPVDTRTSGKTAKRKINYKIISSTLMRQKEHYAARILQIAYRHYRATHGGFSYISKSLSPYNSVVIELAMDEISTASVQDHQKEAKEMHEVCEQDSIELNRKESSEHITECTNADNAVVEFEIDLRPDSGVVA